MLFGVNQMKACRKGTKQLLDCMDVRIFKHSHENYS